MNGTELAVNYGALGIIVTVLLAFAKQTIDRLVRDRDTAERQRDEMTQDVLTKVAPALEGAIKALDRRQVLDDELMDVMVDVRRLLEAGRA